LSYQYEDKFKNDTYKKLLLQVLFRIFNVYARMMKTLQGLERERHPDQEVKKLLLFAKATTPNSTSDDRNETLAAVEMLLKKKVNRYLRFHYCLKT